MVHAYSASSPSLARVWRAWPPNLEERGRSRAVAVAVASSAKTSLDEGRFVSLEVREKIVR